MKHPIQRRVMYLGFRVLQAAAQVLPLPVARAIGRGLGLIAYGLLRAQRRLIYTHLTYAFGQTMAPAARRRVARGVFLNLGQNMMEWLVLPRLSNRQIQALVTSEGVEHLRSALAQQNGAIALTAHFGNWELITLYLRSLGFEGGVLARRLRYPEYESFLIGLRGARGIATFARGSIKDVAKVLRANQVIGMLPDQDMDSLEGIFVDFFGHPTYTPIGPAALSVMTGAPIVPCFIRREGSRFHLVVEPAVTVPPAADRAQAMAALTQAWSRVVESHIRHRPDQWVWMHRRWKTQQSADSAQQLAHRTSEGLALPSKAYHAESVVATVLCAVCCVLCAVVVGCAKSGTPKIKAMVEAPAADVDAATPDPDSAQQMSEFKLIGYQVDGTKKWELRGQGASMENNIVTIHRPDAIGYDPARTAYLTASAAQVNQTNRHVRLEQNVTIHTSDGLWFTAPVLHWIPDQNQMATDTPVRIETDHMLLRGRELDGQTALKHLTIVRDVEMVLNPSEHELPVGEAKQVIITCDGPLSFDYEHNIATFEQNVHVKDPSGDIYSDKLVAYLESASHTIRYAEATGRVRIVQQQNTALSERAVYEPGVGKITLVGKPSLTVYPSQEGKPAAPFFLPGLASVAEPSLPKTKPHAEEPAPVTQADATVKY